MRKFTKSMLVLVLVVFFSPTVHAEISDFFKGDWGVSPEEIRTYYESDPKERSYTLSTHSILTNQYPYTALGGPTIISYTFNKKTRELREVFVPLVFVNINKDDAANIVEQLKNRIKGALSPDKPLTYGEGSSFMNFYLYIWHDTISIFQIATSYNAKKQSLRCEMSFFSIEGYLDPKTFDRFMRNLKKFNE